LRNNRKKKGARKSGGSPRPAQAARPSTTMGAAVARNRQANANQQQQQQRESRAEDENDGGGVNMQTSGKLLEDTNVINGVTVKYSEPQEARKPRTKWRLYVFKGNEELPILYIHRQSAYLMGRDRKVADVPLDHPSCSKQHAVLQYRLVDYKVIIILETYTVCVKSVKSASICDCVVIHCEIPR
jgi:hypothetical protein